MHQTKNWRNSQSWYKNGKRSECENFQLTQLKLNGLNFSKTTKRIHMNDLTIKEKRFFSRDKDGFCWTETFDGELLTRHNHFLLNLKFVCGAGGAQTRSLREVFHFIRAQVEYLNKNVDNVFFINIVDGDEGFKALEKLRYWVKKLEEGNGERIFIGSMENFLERQIDLKNI